MIEVYNKNIECAIKQLCIKVYKKYKIKPLVHLQKNTKHNLIIRIELFLNMYDKVNKVNKYNVDISIKKKQLKYLFIKKYEYYFCLKINNL